MKQNKNENINNNQYCAAVVYYLFSCVRLAVLIPLQSNKMQFNFFKVFHIFILMNYLPLHNKRFGLIKNTAPYRVIFKYKFMTITLVIAKSNMYNNNI